MSLLLAGLLTAAACQSQPAPTPAAPTPAAPVPAGTPGPDTSNAVLCLESVAVQNRKPVPERLTVKAPCRILFTNRDEQPVQFMGPNFIIGELKKDESWVQTFRDPGNYPWSDGNDPNVKGTIIVTP